jgi:signal transduction histidine kinase
MLLRTTKSPQTYSFVKSSYIWALVALIITIVVFGLFIVELTKNYGETRARDELAARTNVAAANIPANIVMNLKGVSDDTSTDEYKIIKNQLIAIKQSFDDMRFVYLMKMVGDDVAFLVDAEPMDSEDYSPPGQVYPNPSPELLHIFENGESFVEGPIQDEWGVWVSGHAPIINWDTGEVVAIIGIDISAKQWEESVAIYWWGCITITLLMLALAIVYFFALWRINIADRDRLLAADDLEHVVDDLKDANKELDAFSYSVSHDLRAPLRHIAGFAQIVGEECKDQLTSECADYLSRIQSGVKKLDNLINGLLGLSRISRKEMKVSRQDLSVMAHAILEQLQQQDAERNVEIVIDDKLEAMGDPDLLRVVLENLLGNAWKYTRYKDQAKIEFGSINEGGEIVYYITDNGVGFNEKYTDKLFQAFQRLHRVEEFEGLGIGLSTVLRIIRRHNGHIWAHGKENEGAKFYFTIGLVADK